MRIVAEETSLVKGGEPIERTKSRHKRLYTIWTGMRKRCSSKSYIGWKYYGGKGISVCEEWNSFYAFQDWALANGYRDDLSIEREDNSKGYCPENCRWATNAEQTRNTSRNHFITAFGETRVLYDWMNDSRAMVGPETVKHRYYYGWSMEDAILTPKQKAGRKPASRK